MAYIDLALRGLICVVFLVSSFSKVGGRAAFVRFVASVRGMRVLPSRLVVPTAVTVVIAEFAIWMLLATPSRVTGVVGFSLAGGMLIAFSIGIAWSLRKGVRVRCRCFGASSSDLSRRQLLRNLLLCAASVSGMGVTQFGVPSWSAEALLASMCGLLIGGLTVVSDDIVELFRPTRVASTER